MPFGICDYLWRVAVTKTLKIKIYLLRHNHEIMSINELAPKSRDLSHIVQWMTQFVEQFQHCCCRVNENLSFYTLFVRTFTKVSDIRPLRSFTNTEKENFRWDVNKKIAKFPE